MADQQYQLAPGVYVNETSEDEYQAAPGVYLNETQAGAPPAGLSIPIAMRHYMRMMGAA